MVAPLAAAPRAAAARAAPRAAASGGRAASGAAPVALRRARAAPGAARSRMLTPPPSAAAGAALPLAQRASASAGGAQHTVAALGRRATPLPVRRTALTPRAQQAGEMVAARPSRELQQASWRGYNDRAGEQQLTLTYSATWLSALSTLKHSKVLRALRGVLAAQAALSITVVAALKFHVSRGGSPWCAIA